METASFCDPNLILRTSSLDSYMNFPINIVGLLHYTIITWKLREQPIIGVLQKYCYKKCRKEMSLTFSWKACKSFHNSSLQSLFEHFYVIKQQQNKTKKPVLVSEAAINVCFRNSLQRGMVNSFTKSNLNVGNFCQNLRLFCKRRV